VLAAQRSTKSRNTHHEIFAALRKKIPHNKTPKKMKK
jgi:hypothetical protein